MCCEVHSGQSADHHRGLKKWYQLKRHTRINQLINNQSSLAQKHFEFEINRCAALLVLVYIFIIRSSSKNSREKHVSPVPAVSSCLNRRGGVDSAWLATGLCGLMECLFLIGVGSLDGRSQVKHMYYLIYWDFFDNLSSY